MYCFEMRTAGNCCVALHLMFVAIAFVFCVGWKGLFGAEDGVRVYICNVYYCFHRYEYILYHCHYHYNYSLTFVDVIIINSIDIILIIIISAIICIVVFFLLLSSLPLL